jgi:hypothetical protein
MGATPPKVDLRALAVGPPAPPAWLVENMLVRRELSMIAGAPKAGKSLLAITIARALATRCDVIGARCPQLGRSLILGAEDPLHATGARVRGASDAECAAIDYRDCHGWTLEGEGFDWLESVAADYDLIIIDSFRRLFPGVDELSPGQTTRALGRLANLAHRAGTAILVLHHTPKSGDTFAGGTGISAAVDALYLLKADDGMRTLSVYEGCMRSVEPPSPRSFRIVSQADGLLSLEPVATPRKAAPDAPQRKAPRKPSATERATATILEVVPVGESLSQGEISRRADVPEGGATYRALTLLESLGRAKKGLDGWTLLRADGDPSEERDGTPKQRPPRRTGRQARPRTTGRRSRVRRRHRSAARMTFRMPQQRRRGKTSPSTTSRGDGRPGRSSEPLRWREPDAARRGARGPR